MKLKNYYHKKINIGFVLMLLFILILILIYFFSFNSYKQRIEDIKSAAIKGFNNEYSITLSIYSEMSDSLFSTIINNKEVLDLFYKGITSEKLEQQNLYRNLLYSSLLPMYNEIIKYNFRQLHFHTDKNISFLRFHKPGRFGDDLTGVRFSVEYVNRFKESIAGFEEGRIYNGYRFVYPLQKDGIHIGTVEISTSMLAIITILSDRFNIPSQFILRKDIMDMKVFESEQSNYIEWPLDSRFVLDKEISMKYPDSFVYDFDFKEEIIKCLDLCNYDPFAVYHNSWENNTMILVLPILNFENEVVGYLLSYRTYNELKLNKQSFLTVSGSILSLFIIMVIFGVYYYKSQKKIKKSADFDYLTDIYMRRVLIERLDVEIERYKRYKSIFSIILFDVDKFKNINDTFGHSYGDYVLKEITKSIKSKIRKSDTFGRYGGEEFILILPETSLENAAIVAEEIRITIENLKLNTVGRVTISSGVQEFNSENKDSLTLIYNADEKLYKAKELGRNRVVF